jgi:hypothetical protein
MANSIIARSGLGFAALAAATGAARADVVTPSFMGDPAIAIGILVVLIIIVWFLIRGALSISAGDKSDEDEAGVGVLEGIDEDDDDKPKRRK